MHIARVHTSGRLARIGAALFLALLDHLVDELGPLALREQCLRHGHIDVARHIEHAQLLHEAQRQALRVARIVGQIVGNDGGQLGVRDVVVAGALQQQRSHGQHHLLAEHRLGVCREATG